MPEIRIDKEFKSLIPPLSREEHQQLEANIISDGCREPLVIWQGILIDGHNRYEICTSHNIPFQTVDKQLETREDVIYWIITNQFGRRNLIPFQRSELALRLKPIIEAKAAQNKSLNGGDKKSDMQKSAPPIEKTKTREELAKLAGVSHDTIKKAAVIQQKATPEQLDRVRKGGTGNTVNAIYTEIKQQEISTKICKECGKELISTEFYEGRNVCKHCINSRKKIVDEKGNRITSNPEANLLAQKYSAEIEHDLYDADKQVEYTTDDLLDELHSLTNYFFRNIKSCLTLHSTLLSVTENKQKIIAALSEAEAAIQKTKELLL